VSRVEADKVWLILGIHLLGPFMGLYSASLSLPTNPSSHSFVKLRINLIIIRYPALRQVPIIPNPRGSPGQDSTFDRIMGKQE